jgi:hypothetical protein
MAFPSRYLVLKELAAPFGGHTSSTACQNPSPNRAGCWTDADPTILRDTTKSDAVATSLREAVKLCLGEAHKSQELPRSTLQHAAASADAA